MAQDRTKLVRCIKRACFRCRMAYTTRTRTQAATLIELQAIIAWEEVPRDPSSEDTSDELAVSVGAGAVAAAAESKAVERVEETKLVVVVDIGRGRATGGEGRREGGKNGQEGGKS